MDVDKEVAGIRAEMREKVVKACEEGQLVGRLVRNFGIDKGRWQRWGGGAVFNNRRRKVGTASWRA